MLSKRPSFTRSSTCWSLHLCEASSFVPWSCLSKKLVYFLASNLGGAWLKPWSVAHLCQGSSPLCVWLKWPNYIRNNNISEVSLSSNQHKYCFSALIMPIYPVLVVKNENYRYFSSSWHVTLCFTPFCFAAKSVATRTFSKCQMFFSLFRWKVRCSALTGPSRRIWSIPFFIPWWEMSIRTPETTGFVYLLRQLGQIKWETSSIAGSCQMYAVPSRSRPSLLLAPNAPFLS